MSYNLSELFERVVDAVGDRTALVTADRRLTYRQLDERANRLAHHLADAGVAAGDFVALQLANGTEYIEAMLACCKLRAVPVNINYRYVERELAHLYSDSGAVALVFHRQFSPRVGPVLPQTPGVRHLLVVDDGSTADAPSTAVEYEEALESSSPRRPHIKRSSDDLYVAYTGGTTGLPKGVLWRHEDIFFAAMGGGDPTYLEGPITDPDQLVSRIPDTGMVGLYTPPFIHVSAQWGAFAGLFGGGTIVVPRPGSFDAEEVLDLLQAERVNVLTVVGDAMARPLLDAVRTEPDRWDLSSLFVFASGGALLSPTTKDIIHELFKNVIVVDGFGSSETGVTGQQATMPGTDAAEGARFTMNADTAVLDADLKPVAPGSEVVGRLAKKGHLPIGYHNDPEKTARTFVEADGVRWVLPGDDAMVDADGTIVVLGRGSVSINTGGEKVYPEEVESMLVAHPGVYDVVVVGAPDERWGERVVAVVAPQEGTELTLESLQEVARGSLAGYKLPRSLVLVDRIERGPTGKPDYQWARSMVGE